MSDKHEKYADILAKMTCVAEDNLHVGFNSQDMEKSANPIVGGLVGAGVGGAGTYMLQDLLSDYYKTKEPTLKHALLGALLGGGVGSIAGDFVANPKPLKFEDTPTKDGVPAGQIQEAYDKVDNTSTDINPIHTGAAAGLYGRLKGRQALVADQAGKVPIPAGVKHKDHLEDIYSQLRSNPAGKKALRKARWRGAGKAGLAAAALTGGYNLLPSYFRFD